MRKTLTTLAVAGALVGSAVAAPSGGERQEASFQPPIIKCAQAPCPGFGRVVIVPRRPFPQFPRF